MNAEPKKKVLIASEDAAFMQEARTAFGAFPDLSLQTAGLEDLAARLKEADIAVLDVGDGDLLGSPDMASIARTTDGVRLVVVSNQLSSERVRQLVRLKATDWLQRPFGMDELVAAVRNLAGPAQRGAGRVTTVTGVAGGPGTTMLALSLARAASLRAEPGQIAIVDLDFQSACVGAYLNRTNEYNLESVVANPSRLDAELADQIADKVEPGISLFSFEWPSLPTAPRGRDFVLRLLDLIAYRFKEVFIDLPAAQTPWYADVVSASDEVFVTFETNVPSLRQARNAIDRMAEIRGGRERIHPVVNKFHQKLFGNVISKKDIRRVLKEASVLTLSRDDGLLTEAMNRGVFPQDVNKGAAYAKEVARLHGAFRK